MKCSACNQDIVPGEKVATGPDGEIHYRCFKRGTAHGEAIDLFSLHDDIGELKRRLQQAEKRIEVLEHDASDPVKHNIRIGSSR